MIKNKLIVFFLITFLLIIASCSSAPKNPEDIDVLRSQAEFWLKSANSNAGQGKFKEALIQLDDAKRNAVLTDDSSLIIRTCLSRGNVLFSLGRSDEAFAEWNRAIAEADRYGDAELKSVSRVYFSRGELLSGRLQANPQSQMRIEELAKIVLKKLEDESSNIKSNRLYIAFSWQVRGLAHRALGEYSEAEDAFKRSLDIHIKDKNMEDASYDWYVIASIRSLWAGKTAQDVLNALEASLAIDRRIENSWGIAASYRAMGDVYQKAGKRSEALAAYSRAKEIYAMLGNTDELAEIEKRIGN